MNPIEVVGEQFSCPVLGKSAFTKITYRTHTASGKRVMLQFQCDNDHDCGVASPSPSGKSFTYDWSKCPRDSALRSSGTR